MDDQQHSYAILYGVAEGRALSQRLKSLLTALGLSESPLPEQADILIVHSGGVIDLPKNVSTKTIIIVAPSIGRKHQSLIITELDKIIHDMYLNVRSGNLLKWLRISAWNIWYLMSQPRRFRRMWSAHKLREQNLPKLVAQNVMIISYRNDPWSAFVPVSEPTLHPKYQFISIDATHDDIWLFPERYVMYLEMHGVTTGVDEKVHSA